MALYVPPSRRRNRLILIGVVALVVGVIVGLLIGRASVTTTGERIASVQTSSEDVATCLQALTIEYEQALAGQGDTLQGGVIDALDGIDRDAQRTLDTAEWLTPAVRAEIEAALAQVRASAVARVDAEAFADQTAAAAEVIRTQLGGSG